MKLQTITLLALCFFIHSTTKTNSPIKRLVTGSAFSIAAIVAQQIHQPESCVDLGLNKALNKLIRSSHPTALIEGERKPTADEMATIKRQLQSYEPLPAPIKQILDSIVFIEEGQQPEFKPFPHKILLKASDLQQKDSGLRILLEHEMQTTMIGNQLSYAIALIAPAAAVPFLAPLIFHPLTIIALPAFINLSAITASTASLYNNVLRNKDNYYQYLLGYGEIKNKKDFFISNQAKNAAKNKRATA